MTATTLTCRSPCVRTASSQPRPRSGEIEWPGGSARRFTPDCQTHNLPARPIAAARLFASADVPLRRPTGTDPARSGETVRSRKLETPVSSRSPGSVPSVGRSPARRVNVTKPLLTRGGSTPILTGSRLTPATAVALPPSVPVGRDTRVLHARSYTTLERRLVDRSRVVGSYTDIR